MKKLTLKEQPTARKLTKAHLILNNTKEDLKKFIKMEAALLYKAIYGKDPDFSEDGGWNICTGDLCENLYINVEIDTCDDIVLKRTEMSEIVVFLDDTVIVVDEDGNEWNDTEYSLEELAAIADLLELTYLNKVNALD